MSLSFCMYFCYLIYPFVISCTFICQVEDNFNVVANHLV